MVGFLSRGSPARRAVQIPDLKSPRRPPQERVSLPSENAKAQAEYSAMKMEKQARYDNLQVAALKKQEVMVARKQKITSRSSSKKPASNLS